MGEPFSTREREEIRRRAVELWASFVAPAEIAARIGASLGELCQLYASELASGAKLNAADAITTTDRRMKAGDVDATITLLVLTSFDQPGIASLIALPRRVLTQTLQ